MPLIQQYCQKYFTKSVSGPHFAAISGGRDSLFLLLKLLEYFKPSELCVLHVNYHTRVESDKEQAFVEEFCKERSIRYFIHHAALNTALVNFEEKAREVRYQWFRKMIPANGVLFLGHTYDDQLETILIRLLRGTGLRGLLGMQAYSNQGGMMLARPLLETKRFDITKDLVRQNISWMDDSSNEHLKYQRNRIRIKLIPLLNGSLIHRLMELSGKVKALLSLLKKVPFEETAFGAELDKNLMIELSNFEIRLLVENIFETYQRYKTPTYKHMGLLEEFLMKNTEGQIQLGDSWYVKQSRGKVFFHFRPFDDKKILKDYLQFNFWEITILESVGTFDDKSVVCTYHVLPNGKSKKKLKKSLESLKLTRWRKQSYPFLFLSDEQMYLLKEGDNEVCMNECVLRIQVQKLKAGA